MHRRRSHTGIWPGFKDKGNASLDSFLPLLQDSFVLGYISLQPPPHTQHTHTKPRIGEVKNGQSGEEPPGQLSPSSSPQLRFQKFQCRELSPSSVFCPPSLSPRVQHKGQRGGVGGGGGGRGGDAVSLWLRRRTHHQHTQCSRSLFCLPRWPLYTILPSLLPPFPILHHGDLHQTLQKAPRLQGAARINKLIILCFVMLLNS